MIRRRDTKLFSSEFSVFEFSVQNSNAFLGLAYAFKLEPAAPYLYYKLIIYVITWNHFTCKLPSNGCAITKAWVKKHLTSLQNTEMHYAPNAASNSIAVIIQHMAGNMLSRWTNFLTEDGEKALAAAG